jgi:uncharacterized membrane-anchored protein YjiN (DUF445 family)
MTFKTLSAEVEPAGYGDLLKTTAQRRSELFRMRAVATLLLVAMTVLFAATRHAQGAFAPYLHAFAEAGMVGACADWFAVTAIFRRPFGLPIPHTAVVPSNKTRLGVALGRFIAQNFLSPRVALRRLHGVDLVALAAHWLADERNARRLAEGAGRLAPFVLSALPRETLARWAGKAARAGLEAIPAATLASRALSVLWAQGAAQDVLNRAVDFFESALERHKGDIVVKVRERSSRWVPRFVDDAVAAKLIAGLSQTLHEMRAPDHPWRAEVEAQVRTLIDQLAHDPVLRARAEALMREVATSPLFTRQIETLVAELVQEDGERARAFAAAALNAASTLGRWLEEDPTRRARLNRTLRLWAMRAVLPRRAAIGGYIAEVVDRWDTRTLVDRLELLVGKDLQFIRINGTLVGGLVGLAIYVVSERLF